jgi:hypothetical protein
VAIVLDVYRALVGSVGETPFVTTSDDVAAARLRTDYRRGKWPAGHQDQP